MVVSGSAQNQQRIPLMTSGNVETHAFLSQALAILANKPQPQKWKLPKEGVMA